jgi:putative membrane protein
MNNRHYLTSLSVFVAAFFTWSAIYPHDYFTWFLEVFPSLIAIPVLVVTYSKFPLTNLVYGLIAVHMIILLVGGHYTYAEMPLFSWLRDYYGWDRNYYDRLGHVAQGFVPAMITREILLRTSPLRPGKWLFFIVVCVCLAISAFYEFIEWWVALASGSDAVAFLATQGDVWDTQWDMFLAFLGAISAQLLLTKVHTRQMRQMHVYID